MLDNRHKAVGDDGCTYLYSNSILCIAPEFLDFKVLLQPFVKKFNLPSVFIQVGDFKSGHVSNSIDVYNNGYAYNCTKKALKNALIEIKNLAF